MNRVPPVALEVGKQVTGHLKCPFMPQERVETGRIQSIQDVGPARIVRVNGLDVFATGAPDSPGWFTDYDPPVIPRARAQTPPRRNRIPKVDPTPPRPRSTGARRRRRRNQTRRR